MYTGTAEEGCHRVRITMKKRVIRLSTGEEMIIHEPIRERYRINGDGKMEFEGTDASQVSKQMEGVHISKTDGNETKSNRGIGQVDLNVFRRQMLDRHNDLRSRHGVPPLTVNDQLNRQAQEWAEYMARREQLEHSKPEDRALNGEKVGENVYWYKGSELPSGEKATQSWYDEIKNVNWSKLRFQSNTGHFTQVVWKSSHEIGMGACANKSQLFVVAQYLPGGNMLNDFENNVFPPK